MRNVTIVLDEALLRDVRRIAAERSTSLEVLIREFLTDLVQTAARHRIRELSRASKAEVGLRTWKREELHGRRFA